MADLACDYCGRIVKNATGKRLHEKSCAQNPVRSAATPESPPIPPAQQDAESLAALLYKELTELRKKFEQMEAREVERARAPIEGGEVPELDGIMNVPVEQRAERLIEVLKNLTPEQRAAREQAIFAAYHKLPPPPTAREGLRPGTYVKTGEDHKGAPTYDKVRYTKEWLESHYEMVDMFVDVDPRGAIQFATVKYPVQVGQIYKVPTIIRDLYEQYKYNLKLLAWRYQPLTLQEHWDTAQRAILTNERVWSRVFLAGWGRMQPEQLGAPSEVPGVGAPATVEA